MKSVLVIGMGRVGRHLSAKMMELGNDVMIVDKDETIIETLAPNFTDANIGDCTNEGVLRSLGVSDFDICFVTIGENFQASLEITSLLKELGAKRVVSKASRDIQAKFLLRNGADDVFYPEREIAERLAICYNEENIFKYVELTHDYGIFEIPVLRDWVGKSMQDINVRKKHNINVLAVKQDETITPIPGAAYVFQPGDHLVVIGQPNDVFRLSSK
jgi:trk system potassium uptake protein TrkA